MATESMQEVLRHLRVALAPRDDDVTDGQLLERFLQERDEVAFAALLRRHGPMVWGVCRRLLASPQDAEDAFQATFLVLVRKGRSVVPREMVASWLHGVARQTAQKARALTARRGARERQVPEMPEPAAPGRDLWDDLRPVLDEELSRLPERYRAVIVLCDLEGRTRKEAARQFGCPEGTVAGRLARARALLARRLAQRGVALSGAALPENAASAGVPASVTSSTIQAATLLAAGQAAGVMSLQVAALTEGVLTTMLLNKFKVATAVLLAIALAGYGSRVLVHAATAPGECERAEGGSPEETKGGKESRAEGKPEAAARRTGPEKARKDKTDQEQLQGTWQMVSARRDGADETDDEEIRQLHVKGDRFILAIRAGKGNPATLTLVEVKCKLDPGKQLKAIDLEIPAVGALVKGRTLRCVYSIDPEKKGEKLLHCVGELKLCIGGPDKDRPNETVRPTRLEEKAGSDWKLLTFEHEPPQSTEQKPRQKNK